MCLFYAGFKRQTKHILQLKNRNELKRDLENRHIRRCILDLYAKNDKRFGAEKTALCLIRDYRINISVGRVYRIMKSINLPKMRTVK